VRRRMPIEKANGPTSASRWQATRMGKERWASVNRWRSAARMITAIMTRDKVKTGNGNGRRSVLAKPKGHNNPKS